MRILRWNKLIKDHSLIAIQEDAMLEVPTYRSRQHDFFEVAPFLNQVAQRIAVRDSDDILFDDGTVIEHRRYVVPCRAQQLDAAVKCLVMRFCAYKCGKE